MCYTITVMKNTLGLPGLFALFFVVAFFATHPIAFGGESNSGCNANALQAVSFGMKNEAVRELQRCLRALGGYNFKVTGSYTGTTKRAVSLFYEDFFGKKVNGKKFDAAGIARMRKLAAQASMAGEEESEAVSVEVKRPNPQKKRVGQGGREQLQALLLDVRAWRKEVRQQGKRYDMNLVDAAREEKEYQHKWGYQATVERTYYETYVWSEQLSKLAQGNPEGIETVLSQVQELFTEAKSKIGRAFNELALEAEEYRQSQARLNAEMAAEAARQRTLLVGVFAYFTVDVPSEYEIKEGAYSPPEAPSVSLHPKSSGGGGGIELSVLPTSHASIAEYLKEIQEYGGQDLAAVTISGVAWHRYLPGGKGDAPVECYGLIRTGRLYQMCRYDEPTTAQDFSRVVQSAKVLQ